ncbi:SGNH/GDSL hydrolase family protein [Rhizosphaericola mali]|uniref:SGNH/GDSL hydrolase family protein n=1 Tax=Rhizosphaericola mali TaxID=2545455 RepID=A0A5P2G3D8_9BACT|nr:SGNH/GDSL hydrolase family protein [Rhizosphaericola mali]QES89238.1 SGNH/GDSL hydrolase family protein [Rhizosphaericola mali]
MKTKYSCKKHYLVLGSILSACLLLLSYKSDIEKPGNASKYSVAQTKVLPNSPLSGKSLIFLGSSVTLGAASEKESFVDFIRKRDNCTCIKDAVSGTTLMDNGNESYIKRLQKLPIQLKVDAFICQLSTNDTHFNGLTKLGLISNTKDTSDYDTNTTLGAIQYIISYVKKTWNCPLFFYTNSYFKDKNYEVLIKELYKIQKKDNIYIIDLYNDKKFNNISSDRLKLYMANDLIHPYKAGYKLWWTPFIEEHLYKILK